MTETELMAKLLNISIDGFLGFSLGMLFLAFLIKLVTEDSSFEYLKQTFWVSLAVITFFVSVETFKAEKLDGFRKDKISVETSNLSSEQKVSYIKALNQDIEDTYKLKVNYMFFLAGMIILGIFIIALRDSIPKWYRNLKKNTLLEKAVNE